MEIIGAGDRMLRIPRVRPVKPVTEEEARANAHLSLAQVMNENVVEHRAGCHGWWCLGGCEERTRKRWYAAGWR